MEIAFFTDSYLPTRDGVAMVTSSLARELTELGNPVTVFAPNPGGGAPTEETSDDGVTVVRSRSLPVPLYGQYRWGLFPFWQLRGRQFHRFDLLHMHTPGIMGSTAFLAARSLRKPLVGTFHTNVWEMRDSFPRTLPLRAFFRVASWYALGAYYRCDVTTVPSVPARNWMVAHSRKPFRRPVEVVPNGIEVERFHPGIPAPDWRERCGLPSVPLLTYFGRLTIDKGVHRFLDSLAELSGREDFVGVVAGEGPEEARVRDRLRTDPRLAGRVRYVGPVAESEKASLLAQSELFVLPSVSDTSSLALLEAMACGAACVAFDVGGPAELIEDGVTGRLVPPDGNGALSHAISDLLASSADRHRLGRAAIEYVRREASIERTATRFMALYGLLLDGRRPDDGRLAG
jgi:glycosyltransferase involved in cell wall biosynthesis